MNNERPVRLPLQAGVSGWQSRARSLAIVAPGWALLAVDVVLMPGFVIFAVIAAISGLLIMEGYLNRDHARKAGPVDAVITAEGLRLAGGPSHGRLLTEAERASLSVIEQERWRRGFWLLDRPRDVPGDHPRKERYLELVVPGQVPLVLAEAVSYDEQRALRAAHRVLTTDPASAASASPATPGSPRDAAGGDAAATPELRALDQVLTPFVTAPAPAPATARLQAIAAAAMWWSWPVVFAGAWLAGLRWSLIAALPLAGSALAVIAALYLAVRARLVARQAYPLIALDYAALPPIDGGAPRCRSCEAALPVVAGLRVARCASCGQDSVLGVELGLPRRRSDPASVVKTVSGWAQTRRRAALGALLAIMLVPVGALAWVVAPRPADPAARHAAACRRGDAKGCQRWALAIRDRDPRRAQALLEEYCDAADPVGRDVCTDLATFLVEEPRQPGWPPVDAARAEELYRASCAGNDRTACALHEKMCKRHREVAGCAVSLPR